jgi:PAS domain S-box-containing protein
MTSKNNQPGAAPSADSTTSPQASSWQVLRRQAEAKLSERRKKAAALPATKSDLQRLVHELEVHQIELTMQNEELVQSRAQVEAGLRQYTDLYDFAPVGYFLLARDGAIHQVNLAGANLLGVERGALIKRRFGMFVSTRSRTTFSAFLEKVFSRSWSEETCEIALQKDGAAPLWVHIEAMTEDGQRKTCRAVVVDITERKQAEEELLASEARYRSYIDATDQIGWVTNADGEVVEDVPSLRKFSGQSYEEAKGLGWAKALHPDDLEHSLQVWNKAVAAKSFYEIEYRMRRHDGVYLYLLARGFPVFREDGSIREWVGTCIDITKRKQANLKLEKQNKELSFQNEEKGKRAAELVIANKELSFQNEEKGKRAAELVIANKELSFQNEEKEKRAAELVIANKELEQEITARNQTEEKLQQTLESLRKSFGATIQVMVSAVEMRDPYTSGHQTRSADLARAIATEMGLPQDTIEGLRMAGSIHDIGKLSIPAEILSKPTKLTDIEFSLIKEHSQKGYEMLKDVESSWPLAQIIYQHHERMDGSGYPRNLKGDEILMEARIMAVADVVEAMASNRPYRPALGIEAALTEIEKNKGIFYDNDVADACLKLFREKGFKLEVT